MMVIIITIIIIIIIYLLFTIIILVYEIITSRLIYPLECPLAFQEPVLKNTSCLQADWEIMYWNN